jgi:uncharacterized protein
VTAEDAIGQLFQAVESGNLEAVRDLASRDPAAVVAPGPDGLSSVLWARYRDRIDVLDVLLSVGPQLDVFEAAAVGWKDRLRELLQGEPALVSAWSVDGFTPLHLAAFFGHAEAVGFLVEHGADPHAVSRNPLSVMPLHSAAAGGHLEAARVLLDGNADPNARTHQGFTALHDAAENGSLDLTELLLERGADPTITDDEGRTARDMAIERGHTDVAFLLEGAG